MRVGHLKTRQSFGTLLLALTLAACGGDGATEPEVETLPGSYDLISLTQEGQPTATPPFVVGSMTLTSSRFTIDLQINVPGMEQHIVDQGTYTANGTSWSQVSDGGIEGAGTYRLEDGLLTTDVLVEDVRVVMLWIRVD